MRPAYFSFFFLASRADATAERSGAGPPVLLFEYHETRSATDNTHRRAPEKLLRGEKLRAEHCVPHPLAYNKTGQGIMEQGDKLDIRKVTAANVGDAAAVMAGSVLVYGPAFYSSAHVEVWHRLVLARASALPSEECHAYLGYCEGVPAAVGAWRREGVVDLLYVAPGFAGRGIGTAMLQFIERCLHEAGVRHKTAQVSKAAERFFLWHGYSIESRTAVERLGLHFDVCMMKK
jgi:putative acetyltransferase